MIGTSNDDVYGSACAMYGFLNVAGVYVDNPDNSFTTIPMRVPKKPTRMCDVLSLEL